MAEQTKQQLYYKITTAIVKDKNGEKEMFGLFVSSKKKFEANFDTYIRGWVTSFLTEESKAEAEVEMRKEAENSKYIESK